MTRITLIPSRALAAGVVASAVAFSATPAFAQMVCGQREQIKQRLHDGYGEVPTGIGAAANGGVIELFTSERGTFTVVLTRPNGLSCLLAVGEGWETVKEPTPARWISYPLAGPGVSLPTP